VEAYYIAGIDVHKKMLAVVIAAVQPGEWEFQRRRFGTTPAQLRELAGWLREQGVSEAVMESTAQYWRPVWAALQGQLRLHLAHAHSNGARRGRKSDFRDAERLTHRLVAGDLVLSFVPDAEQQSWRDLTRTRYQLVVERGRVQSQVENLLERASIKLSSVITDLFGSSGRRILQALSEEAGAPWHSQNLARLAHPSLRASHEQLAEALDGHWSSEHRLLLQLHLERLSLLDRQIETLQQQMAESMKAHQAAVARLCQVPGIRTDAALQLLAEVGPTAASFPSASHLASWAGLCPGQQESAGQSYSKRPAQGNWQMKRVFHQVAHAAALKKGSFFQHLYRRLIVRMGPQKAIGALANRLCRLIWKILHEGVPYVEKGTAPLDPRAIRRRQQKVAAEFRKLGYNVQYVPPTARHHPGNLAVGFRVFDGA
jgi:transposase